MSDYWSSKTIFAGFATGTDFNSIIDATVKTEKFRYNQLSKQEAETTFKKEQIEGLNRTLITYKQQLESMDTMDEFLVKKITSSDESLVTAKVSSGAEEGTHQLVVEQMAKVASVTSHEMKEVAYTGTDTTMDFEYDGVPYSVDVKDGMTTKELAAAITAASDNKVKASVVDLGTGEFKLQMRGMELGEGHDFLLSPELKTVLRGETQGDPLSIEKSTDAVFSVDGIKLQRDTNSVSDVTEGVTYNLLATDIDQTVTITVETDLDTITANVENFVELTNQLRTGFDLVKDYSNEELDKQGLHYSLNGNSQIKSVEDKLKHVLLSEGDGFIPGVDVLTSLSKLGIKTNADTNDPNIGKLEFDKDEPVIKGGTETFMDLLKADPEAVASIFAADGQGSSYDASVLEFNSSMYDMGISKAGSYLIEYEGLDFPPAGDTVTMRINGESVSVGYDAATQLATISEGDGKGISFKVVDTSAGSHSTTISVKGGKVKETIDALNEITDAETGTFTVMIDQYTKQVDDPVFGLKKKMADEMARVEDLEKRLIAQYAQTEKVLADYQNIQKMLEFQLKSQLVSDD